MYLARNDADGLLRVAASARAGAEQLASEGADVRYIESLFVPDEETYFCLYEAGSADAVREVGRRAALPFDRVAEAFTERNVLEASARLEEPGDGGPGR